MRSGHIEVWQKIEPTFAPANWPVIALIQFRRVLRMPLLRMPEGDTERHIAADDAFHVTNSHEQVWWEPELWEGLQAEVVRSRSTSVGDVIVLRYADGDYDALQVLPMGFGSVMLELEDAEASEERP